MFRIVGSPAGSRTNSSQMRAYFSDLTAASYSYYSMETELVTKRLENQDFTAKIMRWHKMKILWMTNEQSS